MHAKKMIEANAIPPTDRLPLFARRYHAHNPEAGKKASMEGFVSAAPPHRKPNSSQERRPSPPSNSSVSQKIIASSNAARLVSQTQRVAKPDGSSAQNHDAHTATFSLKHRRAIKKMGMQVSAEKILFNISSASADDRVYIPKSLKTPAIKNG